MTLKARTCPSGSPCPSQRCRNYLARCGCIFDLEPGREYELVVIARVLGISETQARRDMISGLAKSHAKLDPDYSSSETPTDSQLPRRFSSVLPSVQVRAPRTVRSDSSPPTESASIERRAVPTLPYRFPRKT